MENNIIIALDLGTSRTRIVAGMTAKDKPYGLNVLCYEDMPSQGIRRGGVLNKDEANKVLNNLLIGIDKKLTDLKIKKPRQKNTFVVNIGGLSFATSQNIAKIDLNGQKVTSQTLTNLEKCALARIEASFANDEKLIHIEPIGYSIDSEPFTDNVINRDGGSVEGKYTYTYAKRKAIELTTKAFPAKAAPTEFYPTASAKAQVLLNTAQKRDGVALIDMGSESTSVAIYFQESLRYEISIPLGSDTITHDIAVGLGVSHGDAETIKRHFGIMPEAEANKQYEVALESGKTISFSGVQLNYYTQARAEELAAYIYSALKDGVQQGKCPRDIKLALTGGGAKLKGIGQIIAKQTGNNLTQTIIADIDNIEDDKAEEFAAAIGMISSWAREHVDQEPAGPATLFDPDNIDVAAQSSPTEPKAEAPKQPTQQPETQASEPETRPEQASQAKSEPSAVEPDKKKGEKERGGILGTLSKGWSVLFSADDDVKY